MENLKIAVGLRSARAAIGWNQQEFADKMGVAKTTVARIETLEMAPKADFLTKALMLFKASGVTLDLLTTGKVVVSVESDALQEAQDRLKDDDLRRSDRQKESRLRNPNESSAVQDAFAAAEEKKRG